MERIWEYIFVTNRSFTQRALVGAGCTLGGFGIAYELHRTMGVYFTFVIIITAIVVGVYAGGILGVLFALVLALASDYFFVPPIGTVLSSHAGREHVSIVVATAIAMAFASSSVRNAFRETIKAEQAAERAKREAEETTALMEQILAFVSHDVRNPLATAKMALRVLFQPSNDRQREAEAMLLRNIEQADSMIQSLLDVAAIRAGRSLPLEFRDCDLGEELRGMVTSLASRDRIELVAEPGLRGEWSTSGILRALQNLLANAMKYGQRGSQVRVGLHRHEERVLLSVHNDGPAIAEADQREIFEPFRRTKQSIQSGSTGWGLGLTIVRAVAEAHDGTVSVESAPATGTTFTISMPSQGRASAKTGD
ncbi:MAG TPA: HAMP domain-containing sensor histidine kinase [Polyangiaceae bacterium]|jgi:signal transduction histidine kinase